MSGCDDFVLRSFAEYHPTVDLQELALALGHQLNQPAYQICNAFTGAVHF